MKQLSPGSRPRRRVARLALLAAVPALGVGAAAAVAGSGTFNPVSPALDIFRAAQTHPMPKMHMRGGKFRSIDGWNNNLRDRSMGGADTQLRRLAPSDYGDALSSMSGSSRPSARAVSNAVAAQAGAIPNPFGASDFLWQWGQFIDHDLDLTDGVNPPEPADIPVPPGDPFFDPGATGSMTIGFNRSLYDPATGTSNPRQQMNELTAWIDASQIYGSDEARAAALRTNDGTGRLRTGPGDLLPRNDLGLSNAGGSSPTLFVAGDVRANEQVGLAAMHTLFLREHNRLAGLIAAANPGLSDDEIYERARRIVGAEMQVITYQEFLPALLGPAAPPRYRGYRQRVDARIANEFSTAAFRFGHSALSPVLQRLDATLAPIAQGHLPLRQAFFAPSRISDEGGIDPILRGLAHQVCQRIDVQVVDDVRNFLFGPPGAGGFDLPALNIQRGRDHGLPAYNDLREALGLARAAAFADVSSDPDVRARLASVYASPDDIDPWVGGLAEDPLPGSHLGELAATIVRLQFEAVRDGDRFWYRRTLTSRERREVEATRLSDIIRRNTGIGAEIPDDVFRAAGG